MNMLFNFILFVFNFIYKQIIKRIIFLIMGNHEIERILKTDSTEYNIFIKLSIYIYIIILFNN
jgi:hypothetical protein